MVYQLLFSSPSLRGQSGEAGMTLAFTIIPIHDDNVDFNYEPVSIL